MNELPLVSILINNYNYGRFLKEAIDSALNQTYPNIEVIVVDDGSTDGSQAIIEGYGDRIIAVLKQNGGQASAFNAGFAASCGKIICFLDADDTFKPEKVSKMVYIFQEDTETGWCFHTLEYSKTESEELNKKYSKIQEKNQASLSGKYDLRQDLRRGQLKNKLSFGGTATSGICFRRSLLKKILPMPEEIRITSDDYIKYVAIGLSPGFILLQDLAEQRIHGENAYTFKPNNSQLIAKIQLLTGYWIRKNFSELSKFASTLFAYGMNMHWQLKDSEADCQQLVLGYVSISNPWERLELYLRAYYYYFKSWYYRLQR
jgi:glycosyltransferase involved in cell wall biosynthesis